MFALNVANVLGPWTYRDTARDTRESLGSRRGQILYCVVCSLPIDPTTRPLEVAGLPLHFHCAASRRRHLRG